jgi:hypothetical protein
MEDLKQAIQSKKQQEKLKITCHFATDHSFGIHSHHGIPQLYFDQLNVIAKHLQEINHDKQSVIRSLQSSSETPSSLETIEQFVSIQVYSGHSSSILKET